jgi:hypothetical protein
MKLEDILAVSGKPGLFKLLAQSRNGLIAESLLDGKRLPISSTQQVSALKDIAIYTYDKEVPLTEVFGLMAKLADSEIPNKKSSGAEFHDFFLKILPDYDQERVYTSDIKKVINWYTSLSASGLLAESEAEASVEEVAEVVSEKAEADQEALEETAMPDSEAEPKAE